MTGGSTELRRPAGPPWGFLVSVFLVAKVLATALGLISLWSVQGAVDLSGPGHYQGGHVGPISMWFQWDARWYTELARIDWFAPLSPSAQEYVDHARGDPAFAEGTPSELHRFAFAPLFPLLAKLLATVLFGHEVLAITLIVNAAFFGCLALVYLLGREHFGNERDARWSVVALAALPMSFLFQSAMTESLFLFLVLATMLLASRQQWWAAALFGFLVALTRSTGFVLAVPLVLVAFSQQGWRFDTSAAWRGYAKALPAALAPVLGWLTFMGWCWWRTGDPLAYNHLQHAGWRIGLESPLRVVSDTFADGASPMLAVKLVFVVGVLVALAAAARVLPVGHAVLGLLLLLLPLSIGDRWPQSILRYLAVVYPVALVAVEGARRRPVVAPYLVAAGVGLQAAFLIIWCYSFTGQII
ncbi:MAG TPA: glycosyltransferase family 39 protein [Sporichthya sp.]|nr:glycosyltransferase family 39 protein [Sporichthya sp.]